MICDCNHTQGDHAAGPDEDSTECLVEGCDCMTFVMGDEVESA